MVKFINKGYRKTSIVFTTKTLLLAFDKYTQSHYIYKEINQNKKIWYLYSARTLFGFDYTCRQSFFIYMSSHVKILLRTFARLSVKTWVPPIMRINYWIGHLIKTCQVCQLIVFWECIYDLYRDHSFSTCVNFSEKLTFLTSWYAHIRVRIRG